MRTMCVIHDQDDWISIWLVQMGEGADPMEAVYQELFEGDEDWDTLQGDLECFFLRRGAAGILNNIEWPETSRDDQTFEHNTVKAAVYRAFGIKEVSLQDALEGLDNQAIHRAIGLGWKPKKIEKALEILIWSIPEKEQAQVYREDIMELADDVALAAEATEEIYEQDAHEFLEEDEEPTGPKAPEHMTDDELTNEATQLHGCVRISDCFSAGDVIRLGALERELVDRGYVIHAGIDYEITLQMLEE